MATKTNFLNDHALCPKCGSNDVTKTNKSFTVEDENNYFDDINDASCNNPECKWKGKVKQLKPIQTTEAAKQQKEIELTYKPVFVHPISASEGENAESAFMVINQENAEKGYYFNLKEIAANMILVVNETLASIQENYKAIDDLTEEFNLQVNPVSPSQVSAMIQYIIARNETLNNSITPETDEKTAKNIEFSVSINNSIINMLLFVTKLSKDSPMNMLSEFTNNILGSLESAVIVTSEEINKSFNDTTNTAASKQ